MIETRTQRQKKKFIAWMRNGKMICFVLICWFQLILILIF